MHSRSYSHTLILALSLVASTLTAADVATPATPTPAPAALSTEPASTGSGESSDTSNGTASPNGTTSPAVDQAPPPAPAPATAPPTLSSPASGTYDRRDSLPNVNVYLPEGQASVRLRKLIRNVLFESQIDYRFVTGDISTYLRYKYYARNFTYRLGVFDQISFNDDLLGNNNSEFERVRGGLLLFEFPRDYNNRYYWLIQDDRLTFGRLNNFDNRKNNTYTKVAYEFGSEFDEQLNAIAGEVRGRIVPVLTAFRDLGPQRFSFAAALTQSAAIGPGDYRYTKFEAEALKRSDITATSFLVTRLHAGIFPAKSDVNPVPVPADLDGDGTIDPVPAYAYFTVPRYELFALGGRGALRGLHDRLETRGTHEVHLTNEYFVPIFHGRHLKTGAATWNTLYGIGYVGAGGVGFDAHAAVGSKTAIVDAGLGSEASITIRDFEVILSVLYAHTVHAPEDLRGGKLSFSIRTVR